MYTICPSISHRLSSSLLLLFSLSADEYKLFMEQREEKLKAEAAAEAAAAEAPPGKKK